MGVIYGVDRGTGPLYFFYILNWLVFIYLQIEPDGWVVSTAYC